MLIKYVGPFLRVTAGDYSFTRDEPVEVLDAELVKQLLSAKFNDGRPVFVEVAQVAAEV